MKKFTEIKTNQLTESPFKLIGKDEDKIAKSNLTIVHSDNTPYFEEGKLSIICKKLYAQDLKPE